MQWIKTTFGELKPGEWFFWTEEGAARTQRMTTHPESFGSAYAILDFLCVKGSFNTEVIDNSSTVYRLVSPTTAEREALEKIVQEYKNAVSGSVWLSDAISNVNAIATAALEVK